MGMVEWPSALADARRIRGPQQTTQADAVEKSKSAIAFHAPDNKAKCQWCQTRKLFYESGGNSKLANKSTFGWKSCGRSWIRVGHGVGAGPPDEIGLDFCVTWKPLTRKYAVCA